LECFSCRVRRNETGDWYAELESHRAGPYFSHDLAVQVAGLEALRLRKLGRCARVTVEAADGSVRAERCLCDRFQALSNSHNSA
jgi:hypothetical protein